MLLADGSSLSVYEAVRVVPNKRIVCKANWHGRSVYAKLFLGRQSQAYAQRDKRGVDALLKANVPTPSLLAKTSLVSHAVDVLLFEAIEDSLDAQTLYAQSSIQQREVLISRLVATVAKQHEAGLMQTDMYLKNFLVQPSTIFSIDGDGIRQSSHLSNRTALKNLSALLSKVDVLELLQCLPSWLEIYANTRGWATPPTCEKMQAFIQHARLRAATRFADQKVFRQCSDVSIKQDGQQFLAIAQAYSVALNSMNARQLDKAIQDGTLLKDGNTCTVSLATIHQTPVVIKRYNIKNVGHRLSRMWRASRAAVSWANAHRLQLLGLPTPQPIALLETRTVGLRGKAYFLSEYIQAPDLAESFNAITDKVERAKLVKAVVQLCYRLYLLQISHGDFKATNIKVVAGQPILIDLDSMQQHRWEFFAKRAHVRDLQRLMQNWKHDTSLYNAFIKSFKVVYADHTPLQQANILAINDSE